MPGTTTTATPSAPDAPVEEAPGHRMDPRGHCRCGWELRDAAFRWSADLDVAIAHP